MEFVFIWLSEQIGDVGVYDYDYDDIKAVGSFSFSP